MRLVASAVVSQVMGKGSDDDHQVALSELPDVGTYWRVVSHLKTYINAS